MRKLFNLTYCIAIVLVGQVLAKHNDAILGERHTSLVHSEQRGLREGIHNKSRIESKDFVPLPRITSAPFSQSLATYTFNFKAFCISQKHVDRSVVREYSFVNATCDTESGDPRRFNVNCHSWSYAPFGPARRYSDGIYRFRDACPFRTVCQPFTLIRKGRSQNEVACVDEEDIVTEEVTPANSHADPHVPDLHCGTSLALPGSVFTVKPGVESIDITLTEEARFQDGSPYPAPMLYIRDKTSRWRGFDRVFRRDASVASARVTLTAVAGKFQTRIFEFCMQLSPEMKAGAVTFAYSWFQTTSRHGRRAEHPLIEKKDNRNDTS